MTIFSLLPIHNLVLLERVNKKFQNLAKKPTLWQPILQKQFLSNPPLDESARNYFAKLTAAKKYLLNKWLEHALLNKIFKLTSNRDEVLERIKNEVGEYSPEPDYSVLQKIATTYNLNNNLDALNHCFQIALSSVLSLLPGTLTQDAIDLLTFISSHKRLGFVMGSHKLPLDPITIDRFKELIGDNIDFEPKKYNLLAQAILSLLASMCSIINNDFFNLILHKQPALAQVKLAKKDGCSLLHIAIENGQYEKAKNLIEMGADVNLVDVKITSKMQSKNPLYNTFNSLYPSPLHLALETMRNDADQQIKFIEYLLAKGANPQLECLDRDTDRMDSTPLMLCMEIQKMIDHKSAHHARVFEMCQKVIHAADQFNHSTRMSLTT
ncbi:MAG: hypothetical protein H0W64_05270 [Gammaproteobacteria bacterium]|nr:hypothetical protein [Gammaproteobacteria bacterium]